MIPGTGRVDNGETWSGKHAALVPPGWSPDATRGVRR